MSVQSPSRVSWSRQGEFPRSEVVVIRVIGGTKGRFHRHLRFEEYSWSLSLKSPLQRRGSVDGPPPPPTSCHVGCVEDSGLILCVRGSDI